MPRLFTSFRRLLTCAFALLIVAALQHCAWEAATSVRHMAIVASHRAAGETLPIGLPGDGCENESGCICRGATLAHGFDLAVLQPLPIQLWLADACELPIGVITPEMAAESGILDERCRPPPLSGRILRAHLSSLVI